MKLFRRLIQITLFKFIFRKRFKLLQNKKELYKKNLTHQEIYNFQLKKFNQTWEYCFNNIPFYKDMKVKFNLPEKIKSLKEIEDFPVLTKEIINEKQNYILKNLKNFYLTSTGGTSGINTYFPTSKKDADETYANAYLGRSWWDIKPFSRIIMFWGHSHLFGKGLFSALKKFKRNFKNSLINTIKVSSYDLDVDNLKFFYNKILKNNYDALISYTSNIYMICKYMEAKNYFLNKNQIKNIILTSETVSKADIELISKRLTKRIINEYGMAETGVIAYSFKDTNNIRVLWDSFIINIRDDGKLYITTILPKIFPLINYYSEDLATVKESFKESVLYLASIDGKIRNILKVKCMDGSFRFISTIFFDHILKYEKNIYSIHYVQNIDSIEIVLSSNRKLDLAALKINVLKQAKKQFDFVDPNGILLKQGVSRKTIAGKRCVMITDNF